MVSGVGSQRGQEQPLVAEAKRANRRVIWLLALLVFVTAGPFVQRLAFQQVSRYAFTAALVDKGTLQLDAYDDLLGGDRVDWNGHVYSDKAPGQPFIAAAPYVVYRVAGGVRAEEGSLEENLGVWWVTLWTATIPGALLAVLMHNYAARFSRRFALAAAISVALGTLLLPFSGLLFGHVMAGLLGFSAFYLLEAKPVSRIHLLASGFLASTAVLVEYPASIIAVILTVLVLARYRARSLYFAAGALPGAMALIWYNAAAFGDPFIISYRVTSFGGAVDSPRAVSGLFSQLSLDRTLDILFAPRGLAVATPIIVVAVAGLFVLFRTADGRASALVSAAVLLCFFVLAAFWGSAWAGDSPGARYMTPAMPFLIAPIALAWQRWPRISFLASGIGITTMVLALVTEPLIPAKATGGLGVWSSLALKGHMNTTLFTMLSPTLGWLLHLGVVALTAYAVSRVWRSAQRIAASTAHS